MEDKSSLTDYIDTNLTEGVGTSQKKKYEVISENGLFKNGNQINKGESIELDEKTAANFIASGDIKEAQS